MDFIGQTLAGKYRIEEVLQTGGIGQLYRAMHILMDKRVTVKVLNPALAQDAQIAERFAAEAKIASRLSHPNILSVTDYGTDENGNIFIVTENLEGETLAQVIRREGNVSLKRTLEIIRQISSALTAAQSLNISHLNLNTENILLTKTGDGKDWLKVYNFSVAPAGGDNDLTAPETEPTLETARYLSPEQCINGEADNRSDVYSLGIILYEMLTGRVPFNGTTAREVMLQHLEMPPPALTEVRPDLPIQIEHVLSRALAKKPPLRFQNVADFSDFLTTAAVEIGEEETVVRPREMSAAAGAGGETGETGETDSNFWKTGFIVTLGITVLSGVLFYITWGPRSDVPTVADANASPVQPINPATGVSEQNLTYNPMSPNANMSNAQVVPGDPYGGMPNVPGGIPPGVPFGQSPSSGSSVYNYPPAGSAPLTSIPQGVPTGPIVTADCGSEFMPCETTKLPPVQVPANVAAGKPASGANVNANVNTNSNKATAKTNSNAKPTTDANMGGAKPPAQPKNANVAPPTTGNPPDAGTNPEAKPTEKKQVPKPSPKPADKRATEKPKTEKPKTAPESTGKQLE